MKANVGLRQDVVLTGLKPYVYCRVGAGHVDVMSDRLRDQSRAHHLYIILTLLFFTEKKKAPPLTGEGRLKISRRTNKKQPVRLYQSMIIQGALHRRMGFPLGYFTGIAWWI